MLLRQIKKNKKFIKFSIVGAITACIYILEIILFYNYLDFNYLYVVFFSYLSCNLFHFYANKIFTFGLTEKKISTNKVLNYVAIILLNTFLTMIFVFFLKEIIGFSVILASIFTLFVTVLVGFYLMKKFVFN